MKICTTKVENCPFQTSLKHKERLIWNISLGEQHKQVIFYTILSQHPGAELKKQPACKSAKDISEGSRLLGTLLLVHNGRGKTTVKTGSICNELN